MEHRNLFDVHSSENSQKEVISVDKIKNLEEKISSAIEKVKSLKNENGQLNDRIKELEGILSQRDAEISSLSSEKDSIRGHVEELLGELESLEI
jgi:chromosome segregation ATPase